MNEVLTYTEIVQRYPSEWVLLGDVDDPRAPVPQGRIVFHCKERDEFYRHVGELHLPRSLAFYTGPDPQPFFLSPPWLTHSTLNKG
jgi:hypothetical protein